MEEPEWFCEADSVFASPAWKNMTDGTAGNALDQCRQNGNGLAFFYEMLESRNIDWQHYFIASMQQKPGCTHNSAAPATTGSVCEDKEFWEVKKIGDKTKGLVKELKTLLSENKNQACPFQSEHLEL